MKIVKNDIFEIKEIEKILSCISINKKDNNYINEDEYHFDYITYYPGNKYESKYIGITKRVEIKKRLIIEKEKEIELSKGIINNYQNMLKKSEQKLEDIKNDSENFPCDDEINETAALINNINIEINITEENIKKISEIIENTNIEIEKNIKEINGLKDNIIIPINITSIKEVQGEIKILYKEIPNLKICHNNIKGNMESKNIKEEMLNDIETDMIKHQK